MQYRSFTVLADTRCSLPDQLIQENLQLSLKPAEVVWNGMTTIDEPDEFNRRLFMANAEVNPRTSGLPDRSDWPWAEFIADRGVEADTFFILHPDKRLFSAEAGDLVKSSISLKLQHGKFLEAHGKKPQQIKLALVDTGTWFGGVGLAVWQSLTYLKRLDLSTRHSVSGIKQNLLRLSQRTVQVSLIPAKQANPGFIKLAQEQGLEKRMSFGFNRDVWYGCCISNGTITMLNQASFEDQLNLLLKPLSDELSRGKLAFPRVLLHTSDDMYKRVKQSPSWQAIDEQQKPRKFQVIQQLPGLTAQVLMGKDAVHFSYVLRGKT